MCQGKKPKTDIKLRYDAASPNNPKQNAISSTGEIVLEVPVLRFSPAAVHSRGVDRDKTA
jgi:hypothetical protein